MLTEEEQAFYTTHQADSRACLADKAAAVLRAQEDEEFAACCFDLQQVSNQLWC